MVWNFKSYTDKIAMIDDSKKMLTYGQLEDEIEYFKNVVRERCLIFCICKNTIGSLLGYISCIHSKVVPLMLSEEMDHTLFRQLEEKYHPKYVWAPESYDFPSEMIKTNFGRYGYRLYRTQHEVKIKLHDELALLLTTSGSTGSPKLVRQSYINIAANTSSIVEYLKLDSREKAITTLPMNYTYGLSIINTHLAVGATVLLTERTLFEKEFWEFFRDQGATSFGGVPYTYEMLKKLRFLKMTLPTLNVMTQAGGHLSSELHQEFAEFACRSNILFFIMYGASEATARMSYLPSEKSLEKKGSIGIAIPGGRFELIDAEGNIINEPNKIGELVYYGKNVTLGYALDVEDLAKGDERQGRLETGDMAYIDEDGFYYIAGRKKRFLKVFGNRFGLDEAENILKQHFTESNFACTGYDDAVYIFVEGQINKAEVRHYISNVTKIHISAFHVCSIDKIPRNTAGKITYSELERYYEK